MPSKPWPIVIAGGGINGLGLALALKRALGEACHVVVADPLLGLKNEGSRAYALGGAARRFLDRLGLWAELESRTQPIGEMVITDSRLSDPVRPAFLRFGEAEAGFPLAHMIEAEILVTALDEACGRAGVVLEAESVTAFEVGPANVRIEFSSGRNWEACLLVAADGARSRIRQEAGIGWVSWPYRQSGIVATLSHERDHEGRAIEHFLPSGPFAILPLTKGGTLGHRSSIVWTESAEDAAHLLALDEQDSLIEIERRFGLQLGKLHLETKPKAWPLSFGIARNFVAPRLALLGDAAHVIHPIAGQGLNLGLKDAEALAQEIFEAAKLGLDPGHLETLKAYERARRFETVAMGAVTDGLNRLFCVDHGPVRALRDLGLGLVERMPPVKRFFMREAAGG